MATRSSQPAALRPERLPASAAVPDWRRAIADGLGTAFLLAVVVGSGIMGAFVIRGASRLGVAAVAVAVGAYITSAYWFTSSTSFANPAVTLARAATNTFTGIRPIDAPGFVVAQLLGGAAAIWVLSRVTDD